MNGIQLIQEERERQLSKLGWSPEHDDGHTGQELAIAACRYAAPYGHDLKVYSALAWPWDENYWKAQPSRIRELAKAGALIAAEIDRLIRKDEIQD